MTRFLSRWVLLFFLFSALVSCGGGGGTKNQPPVADGGVDQLVIPGTRVFLDGAASSDPDGDPLTYHWSLLPSAGSTAALSDSSSAAPAFTADRVGTYNISLVVNDGKASSMADTVTVTASSYIATAPTAMIPNTFYSGQLSIDSYPLASGEVFNLAAFSLSSEAFVSAWAGSQITGDRLQVRAYASDALDDPWFLTWGTWDLGSLEDGLSLPAGDYVVTLAGDMTLPFAYSAVVWRADPATGILDTSFDGDGKRIDAVGTGADELQEIVVQPDGRIVAVGVSDSGAQAHSYDLALVRYLRNGALDASFGTGGKVRKTLGLTRSQVARETAVALQRDGKIIAASTAQGDGDTDFVVMRYLHDGSPDTSFGTDGIVTIDIGGDDRARDVAVREDGAIVVAGESGTDMAFAVLDPDGVADPAFNLTGTLSVAFAGTAGASALVLRPDGRICASGRAFAGTEYSFALVGVNLNGTMDTSVNGTGYVLTKLGVGEPFPRDMALQEDGKILVTGHYLKGMNGFNQPDHDVAVLRYLPSGALDQGFGADGLVTVSWGGTEYDRGTGVAIQPDGRILVSGWYDYYSGSFYSWYVGVYRLLENGVPDSSFGADGRLTLSWPSHSQVSAAEDVAIQPDGRILVGGFVDTWVIFQYNMDFTLGRIR
ncbi:MAG: PKD domain-containing protein [bacterium]|nr:PKD domain-containing protein [bacterium]